MNKSRFPIHIVRTWWSIDQVYHTDTEAIWFDAEKSPVVHTLERLWLSYAKDRRVTWVNSSDLTEEHLIDLMRVLHNASHNTRIIITSGTGAIPRIAKKIKESKFLDRPNNELHSIPNIVQVATHLPWFLWDRGDIRDSISMAHTILSTELHQRWQHLVVVWRTLLFASDILAWRVAIPKTPEDQKIIF